MVWILSWFNKYLNDKQNNEKFFYGISFKIHSSFFSFGWSVLALSHLDYILSYKNYIFCAIQTDNPTNTAIINELVKRTCPWWTNMCIIWDLNDNLDAPLGGLISSLVANGDKINARRMLSTTPTVDALIKNFSL